jgi:hypothetical protein
VWSSHYFLGSGLVIGRTLGSVLGDMLETVCITGAAECFLALEGQSMSHISRYAAVLVLVVEAKYRE